MTATIYRGLTPAQLKNAYSARDAVPEHPAIFERWQQQSSDYLQTANALIDIAYGPAPREQFDLFLPTAVNPPLHIFIHGGYWQAMDKQFFSFAARELNRQGIAVAIPNYDLCPDTNLDTIAEQIGRAVSWLATEGSQYGIDSEQIHLSGHSAGGQLIGMLMSRHWQNDEQQTASSIRSALSISGIFELEPLLHTPINDALGLDLEAAKRNSPLLKSPTLNVPLALTVGGDESHEFHRQSRTLANHWKEAGIPTSCQIMKGLNHFTMVEQLAQRGSPLLQLALKLIKG